MQLAAVYSALMPHLAQHFDAYARACMEWGVYAHPAFLAQLAHESGGGKWMQELATGEEYEGRKDLGNTQPGDGKRYKGRGPIQLTGRANYRKAGEALGLNLEADPGNVATPSVGFRVAAWFWATHKCDTLPFEKITRVINGGTNGAEHRNKLFAKATQLFETP